MQQKEMLDSAGSKDLIQHRKALQALHGMYSTHMYNPLVLNGYKYDAFLLQVL